MSIVVHTVNKQCVRIQRWCVVGIGRDIRERVAQTLQSTHSQRPSRCSSVQAARARWLSGGPCPTSRHSLPRSAQEIDHIGWKISTTKVRCRYQIEFKIEKRKKENYIKLIGNFIYCDQCIRKYRWAQGD